MIGGGGGSDSLSHPPLPPNKTCHCRLHSYCNNYYYHRDCCCCYCYSTAGRKCLMYEPVRSGPRLRRSDRIRIHTGCVASVFRMLCGTARTSEVVATDGWVFRRQIMNPAQNRIRSIGVPAHRVSDVSVRIPSRSPTPTSCPVHGTVRHVKTVRRGPREIDVNCVQYQPRP